MTVIHRRAPRAVVAAPVALALAVVSLVLPAAPAAASAGYAQVDRFSFRFDTTHVPAGAMTPPYLAPRPLAASHDIASFDCRSAEQNAWLRRHARQSHQSDSTRVFMVTERGSDTVVAFYAIRMGEVAFADASTRLAKGQGRHPQPVMLIARLGVDRQHEGRGLGSSLLRHAFFKTLEAAADVGCRAIAVHCEDDDARRFYLNVVPAFEPSPTDPLHLILLIKDLRASIG